MKKSEEISIYSKLFLGIGLISLILIIIFIFGYILGEYDAGLKFLDILTKLHC